MEETKYEAVTSEEFYNKFGDLSNKITNLSRLFQNDGTRLTSDGYAEWTNAADEVAYELRQLLNEADARIVLISELEKGL